jgi:hypothetical protein
MSDFNRNFLLCYNRNFSYCCDTMPGGNLPRRNMCYDSPYKMPRLETPADVKRWFMAALHKIGPVAKGSLSLRRSPCIRKNCPACARGEGHPSYALYGRSGGRRFTIHIPKHLAPEVNAAVQNGRHLQELINEAGVRYLKALKRQLQAAKPRARQKPARQRRGRSRDA